MRSACKPVWLMLSQAVLTLGQGFSMHKDPTAYKIKRVKTLQKRKQMYGLKTRVNQLHQMAKRDRPQP